MIIRKIISLITLPIIFIFFLTACQSSTTEQTTSGTFYYKVILADENNHPIKNTEVKLDITGAPTMITEITDNNGFVVFIIDGEYKSNVANLFALDDNYQTIVIILDDDGRSNRLLLELSEASIAKIQTPIPPTQIATSQIIPTIEPSSEPLTIQSTSTPKMVVDIRCVGALPTQLFVGDKAKVITWQLHVRIDAGIQHESLGILAKDQIITIIGEPKCNDRQLWYYIISDEFVNADGKTVQLEGWCAEESNNNYLLQPIDN